MRKLVFMLRVNDFFHRKNSLNNLEISTHKGARLFIENNHATVLDVTDDPMTDTELQNWYRSRYYGFGLKVSVLNDDFVGVSLPNASGSDLSEISVSHVEPKMSIDEKPLEFKVLEEKVSEEKVFTEKTPDEMTYYEMLKFAKLHGITVKGKAKGTYKAAVEEWFKAHDGQ